MRLTDSKALWDRAIALPDPTGAPGLALVGYGSAATRKRSRFHLAEAANALPEGAYALAAGGVPEHQLATESLGWLLAGYRFHTYRKGADMKARLVCPEGVNATEVETIAQSEALTRDLINTPCVRHGPPRTGTGRPQSGDRI